MGSPRGNELRLRRCEGGPLRGARGDGAAASLPTLAIRYAPSTEGLDTFAAGPSSLGRLQEALDAVVAGPLDAGVLDEIARIQSSLRRPAELCAFGEVAPDRRPPYGPVSPEGELSHIRRFLEGDGGLLDGRRG